MYRVLIQARLGSKRFPRKVLAPLGGKPMLEFLCDRLKQHKPLVILPECDREDRDLLHTRWRRVFWGPENDVLSRYVRVARLFGLDDDDYVVRITGDCPLIDPELIRLAVERAQSLQSDYLSNTIVRTFPDGQDVEVIRVSALRQLDQLSSEREHWTFHVPRHISNWDQIYSRSPESSLAKMSVDTAEDLERVRSLVASCGADATWEEYWLAHKIGRPFRRERYTPEGTQTLSKKHPVAQRGGSEQFAKIGRDWKIDWTMGLGTNILGYGCFPVLSYEIEALINHGGHSMSHPTNLEGLAAAKILEHTPGASMVRFGKNGSDAIAFAVRLARAHTGRRKIVTWGYHGWHDPYVPGLRVVPGVENDADIVFAKPFQADLGDVAAVLYEPTILSPNDALRLQSEAREAGALVISDEVITGFRHRLGKAILWFGDLTCYGKCIGNGAPISAVCGPVGIMSRAGPCHLSSTFGGSVGSLAATIATISVLERMNYEDKNDLGVTLRLSFPDMEGPDSRPVLPFANNAERDEFREMCLHEGIVSMGIHNISFSHTNEDVDRTIEAYHRILGVKA